jgi:hypothetical protein
MFAVGAYKAFLINLGNDIKIGDEGITKAGEFTETDVYDVMLERTVSIMDYVMKGDNEPNWEYKNEFFDTIFPDLEVERPDIYSGEDGLDQNCHNIMAFMFLIDI